MRGSFLRVISPSLAMADPSMSKAPFPIMVRGGPPPAGGAPQSLSTFPLIVTAPPPAISTSTQSPVMVPAIEMSPATSRSRSSVIVTVTPAGMVTLPNETSPSSVVSPSGSKSAGLTVTAAVPLFPSEVAVMVAAPTATPVTIPVASTVAIPPSEVDQTMVRPTRTVPSAAFVVAVS